MPLPPQIQLSNTFGQWINTTNQIITATGNSSEYILVAQNATPQTSSGNVSVNGTITVVNLTSNGTLIANNGSKIVVQGGTDGTSTRGIFLWTATDSNWGLYLSQAGASKSLANGTSVGSIDSRSGWHVRNRSGSLNTEGFIWENQNEIALMSLTGDTGNLYLKGNVYVGNTTSAVVIHTESTTGINASAVSTGTLPLGRLSSANTSANGVVDTTTQSFAGNKTFTNNVEILGYLTVGNSTITLNSTTLVLGNSLSNLVFTSAGVTKDGTTIIDSSGVSNNALNLNSQPASYYTNASNLGSGTLPNARLSGSYTNVTSLAVGANVVVNTTVVFVGNTTTNATVTQLAITVANNTNTATLSPVFLKIAGTTANTQLWSNSLIVGEGGGSNVTINTTALVVDGATLNSTAYTGTANNATNLNGQPASYYTNASNISSGTLAVGRLDANVLLTTSTTGINASALSTGTVPLGRLLSANSSANGVVDTTTQTFAGNKTFDNDVTVTGNLNVLGTTTTVSANNLIVDDSLIQLAANNTTSDALDIGLFGNYNGDGGAHEHAGLFRDATDGTWRLFVGLQETPTTTVNTAGTGYAVGTLLSYLNSGIFTTNTTQFKVTANSSYSANLTINTLSVSGAVNALSTLGVGGTFTALGTSTLTGAATLSNTVSITGAVNALSTLGVGGVFTALVTSTLTGAVTMSNTVTVTGTATMNGTIDANNKLTLNTTNGRFVLPVGVDKWAT